MKTEHSVNKINSSLHIAVCDDNVGDRKQTERLLNRESDVRGSSTAAFYVDSFGSADTVMQSPMLYDVFFIDMVYGDTGGIRLAERLMNAGVVSPIVLCISSVNYREAVSDVSGHAAGNIFFLDKPIKKDDLSQILDMCILKKSERVLTIELRGEKDTRYVTEDDIVFAKLSGNNVSVYLKDGSMINIPGTLENFYSQIAHFSHYAALNKKSMLNVAFVSKVTSFRVTMADGTSLPAAPSYAGNIKTALRQYTEEL